MSKKSWIQATKSDFAIDSIISRSIAGIDQITPASSKSPSSPVPFHKFTLSPWRIVLGWINKLFASAMRNGAPSQVSSQQTNPSMTMETSSTGKTISVINPLSWLIAFVPFYRVYCFYFADLVLCSVWTCLDARLNRSSLSWSVDVFIGLIRDSPASRWRRVMRTFLFVIRQGLMTTGWYAYQ